MTASGGTGAAPCCGARLKTGGNCALPPAAGKRRCFQHGGRATGAPKGNRHNWRDGFYSREAMAERRRINGFIRACLRTLKDVE